MNIKSLIATASAAALACMVLLVANNNSQAVSKDSIEGDLLACVWFPYCNDPEGSKPIVQPTDNKTDSQDAKDNKLA